jgi:hypothetical protein
MLWAVTLLYMTNMLKHDSSLELKMKPGSSYERLGEMGGFWMKDPYQYVQTWTEMNESVKVKKEPDRGKVLTISPNLKPKVGNRVRVFLGGPPRDVPRNEIKDHGTILFKI